MTPARVDAFPRGSATATPAPPSAAGPSPAQKHCDAAIDKLDAILRSPKPLTLASPGRARKLARSPPTPRDTSANANVTPSAAVPPASRGATPSAAHVPRRQLTPNSEFAALEMAVAAEAEEQRRVAEEDALAAKEAAAAMLMRQESVKASSLTPGRGVASPRSKPPRSPSLGAKASALSRTASAASASVLGTPPRASPRFEPRTLFLRRRRSRRRCCRPPRCCRRCRRPPPRSRLWRTPAPALPPGRRRARRARRRAPRRLRRLRTPWRAQRARARSETRRVFEPVAGCCRRAFRLARRRSPRRRTASRGRSRHPPRCRR